MGFLLLESDVLNARTDNEGKERAEDAIIEAT